MRRRGHVGSSGNCRAGARLAGSLLITGAALDPLASARLADEQLDEPAAASITGAASDQLARAPPRCR